jgi:hypothetical protein
MVVLQSMENTKVFDLVNHVNCKLEVKLLYDWQFTPIQFLAASCLSFTTKVILIN